MLGMYMHIEISKVPPNISVGVALSSFNRGRYKVAAEDFVEELETIPALRAWLEYCNMFSLLIERVIAEVQANGICILRHKGIIIKDTEWRNPVTSVNWANCKFPTYLKLKESNE